MQPGKLGSFFKLKHYLIRCDVRRRGTRIDQFGQIQTVLTSLNVEVRRDVDGSAYLILREDEVLGVAENVSEPVTA